MSEIFDKGLSGGATETNAEQGFLVVGLGASAGGIQALREFFSKVPADSQMAYVVILHLSPDHDSQLAQVLQGAATVPVTQVIERVRVEPNHVYVISPNKNLAMKDGHLLVSNATSTEVRRAPVDIFFRTLAESHRERAVSVVLSGTGANGSMGMKRVKERGGCCIVQDPREAEYADMPRHSLATGLVDYVLPVAEIPAQIVAYRDGLKQIRIPQAQPEPPEQKEANEAALRDILTQLRVRTGHDFSNYKRATIMRRIARRMGVHELADLTAYSQLMHEHPQEANALLKDLLISVTNFFRDREAFEALEREVIPRLFEGKTADDQVRVWVAGCATGEEAYTLAMLLAEYSDNLPAPPQIQVFATDIDEAAIAVARDGSYTLNDAADISPERLARYFVKEGDNEFRVRREIRERVLFAVHNVIKDPPFSHLDLVTCRNLLIYLNQKAQKRVMDVLHFALNAGGYLMLGASESVDGASDLYVAVDKEHHIYQGRAVETRLVFPVPDGSLAMRLGKLPELRRAGEKRPATVSSYGELHQRLLERYAPPSVVVNEDYDIVHMSESAGLYMQLKGGEPSTNLLMLIRPELRLELRAALYQATQKRMDVEARGIALPVGGETKLVNVLVRPVLSQEDKARGFILVLFEEARAAEQSGEPRVLRVASEDEPLVRQLEEELLEVRAQLSATVEQHELQREELKASNEELQAMNEEMRSAAEELETSKEELQSINEELTTVNQELKVKIEELGHTNDDFRNLINSTQIGTIFLDRSLRVKLFTPRARDLFNLIQTDTGRLLSDITSKLQANSLIADAEIVLERLHAVEREVRATDGRVYAMRLLPYRTTEDRINGVVATFFDITERKRAEEALRESEEQFRRSIEDAPIPVIMHAEDGEVLQISRSWMELTGYTLEDKDVIQTWLTRAYGFGGEQLRDAMEHSFAPQAGEPMRAVVFDIITKQGEHRTWSFSASAPGTLRDGRRFVVGMAEDITERKRAEERLRESEEKYRTLFDSIDEGFCIIEMMFDDAGRPIDFAYVEANEGFKRQTGRKPKPGQTMHELFPEAGDMWLDAYAEVLRTGIPKRFVDYNEGLDRWYEVYVFPTSAPKERMQLAALFKDVTDEKRAEEALRESEERLRLMMESVTDYAILTMDTKGCITSWNRGAERIFGYAEKEAVGQFSKIIFTPEDRAKGEDEKEMREAREKGRAADERWHLRKDGSRFYVSGVLAPLHNSDKLTGYAKIARDLTEQRRVAEELRRTHEEMEDRVRERTFELAKTNESLRDEIYQRIQVEKDRVRLLRQIVRAQEDERRRIARDIHDQLGQQMTALRLNLGSLDQGCDQDAELRGKLEQTKGIAERLDADVDFLAWELRPAALDDIGLTEALGNYIREWSTHFGIEAEFHARGMDKGRLAPETETNLYRITQEALNNIMKYAKATRVDVLLERRDNNAVLIIEDNGIGFNPKKEMSVKGGKGMGLIGMRERAVLVGGTLEIESKPKEGTTIFARVPVRFLEEEEEAGEAMS